MGPQLIAVLALLLAPAFGQSPPRPIDCEQDFGGLIPRDAVCSTSERREIVNAVQDACHITVGCLIRDGLNPDLGARIIDYLQTGRVRFNCADSLSSGHGGETHQESDGSASIQMVSWPPVALRMERTDRNSLVLFHELIHATDPAESKQLSHDLHNRLVFPDAVYGCHVACQGDFTSDAPAKQAALYEEAAMTPLPEMDSWACRGSSEHCRTVRQYAWLCRNNVPFTNEHVRQNRPLLSTTECVAGAIHQTPDEILYRMLRSAEQGDAATLTPSQRQMLGILQRDGIIAACQRNPESY